MLENQNKLRGGACQVNEDNLAQRDMRKGVFWSYGAPDGLLERLSIGNRNVL